LAKVKSVKLSYFLGSTPITRRVAVMARKARSALRAAVWTIYRLCSKSDFTWRYVANLRPSLEYPRTRKTLSAEHEQILMRLKRDGIAITSVDKLIGGLSLFEELQTAVGNCEASLAKEIEARRVNAKAASPDRNKGYVVTLLGRLPTLDVNDIFVRFALQSEVLAIANGYFGMLTKLRYYNVWHNLPTYTSPRESQLWHRDPEDRCILKMFVYLTDVDEGAGPLSYAPGTHSLGAIRTLARSQIFREGRSYVHRTDDTQMNEAVPKEHWITAVGPKGTVVLVDTKGYHKGGFCVARERIVYTCMFTSKAGTCSDSFKRQQVVPRYTDRSVAFAIEA
jgi:Phytanoyl-CoA dioxygenase (PhyH)